MNVNIIEAYNYRILESILVSQRKYLAFTLNTEDYDEIFQLGKQGVILRPTKEELSHDIIHKLSRWSGLPVDYLYGERQIITGLYLNQSINGAILPRFDDQIAQVKDLIEFDDLWADPLGLDEFINDEVVEEHGLDALLEVLNFRLRRSNRLPNVPSLHPRQDRTFGESNPRLRRLANLLLTTLGGKSAQCETKVEALEQNLAAIHFGKPFEKLACQLADAMR